MRVFEVGGAVRDKLMGLDPKDFDFAVECDKFEDIIEHIESSGGKVYLSTPEFYTVRARLNNIDADFVWCRIEGPYSDSRHPDWVKPGTIYDDLARRDFTMNAIAIDEDGNYIDPHSGILDIDNRRIKCVGNTEDRMNEDALRMIRAIRFSITKDMKLSYPIMKFLDNISSINLLSSISTDRIREELTICFSYNTYRTLRTFNRFSNIEAYLFGVDKQIWLKPTTEKRNA